MKNLSKLGKRGLALVLALVLLVGMVPLSASANTYDQITVNYVVNGVTLRTDTLNSGRYIQIANRVPYVSSLIAGTAYADYDYGTVTKIECRPHQYFPTANFLREGQSIDHSGNYKNHTIYYTTSKWEKHTSSGGVTDPGTSTVPGTSSGSGSYFLQVVYVNKAKTEYSFGPRTASSTISRRWYYDNRLNPVPEGYELKGWQTSHYHGTSAFLSKGWWGIQGSSTTDLITSAPYNSTVGLNSGEGVYLIYQATKDPAPPATYSYILNWEYNGGTLNGKDHDSETALNLTGEKNATHTFYEQVDKRPSRNGYKFGGWVYSGNGTFTESHGQIVMTGRDGSTVTGTMTAQWYANPSVQVTLTYDANGGENPPAKQMVNVGSEVIVKGKEQMTKSGYTFKGWSNRSDATEPDVMPENTLRLNDNTTLFAVWERNKTITVTWKDGYTNTPIKTVTIDQGGDYSTLYPSAPTREGYTFTKWGEPVVDLEGNITITAQWKQNAETPNISISKIPDATAYTAGADVSWNITVTNNGTSAVSGLSIADELTKDSEPFTGVAITSPDGFSVTPDNFTLEAGQSVTFKAIVAEAAAGTYVNTAKVEKDGEPLAEDTSENVVVTEETEPAAPAITVRKEADKTAAKAGETVTYTITVENTGDAQATNVTVTDVLDSNLTFVSYQLGEETVDTQPEGGVYTIGTLEANDVATLVIQATVNADVEAGTIIVNTATADYDGKPDEENPTDRAEVNVIQPDPVDPDPDPTDPGPGPVDPPTPPTPIVTPEPVATPTPSAEPTAEPTDDPGVDIPDPTQPPLGPGP
ncbi:InlB B-repeat-containing protein, partial [Acutalibacter caecimuris]|uniref:InlB B-repeat-containing protein n=1 Tax=Acutalibacter caecimuris TaxID=3093657 RepID=UPI002AC954F2